MRMDVDAIEAVTHQLEVVSPELALVDPELGRAARALLVDPAEAAARVRLISSASEHDRPELVWPMEQRTPGEHASRRLLFGVAAVTMLALLLFDVRVEVGQRPAAAEPDVHADQKPATVVTSSPPATAPTASKTTAKRPRKALGHVAASRERRFAWAPFQGATGYHVEFFRGTKRVFAADTSGPSLTVPASWTFEGDRQSLRSGKYGWYVWPVVGGRRQSSAVVQTTVSIPER